MDDIEFFDDIFVTMKFHLFQRKLMNDEILNIMGFAGAAKKLLQRTFVRFPCGRTF